MKRILLTIVLFLLAAAFVSAQEMTYSNLRDGNGISINLELNSYQISSMNYKSEEMHEIILSGIFIPNDEGMPNLPRISRFVAVPKGAEVRVSVKNMETETLQNVNIAPALRIQAIPEEPATDYVKNSKVYATDAFYPYNVCEVSEVTSLRGVDVVMVGITPFQFNPVTKELIVVNNIEIEVEYVGGSREYGDVKYRSPWFDPILKNALLNYDVLPEVEYTGKSARNGTGCEYLIIIPNRSDFEPYAEQIKEFRTKQGIYTKVMRLDEMGVSTNTQLKTYIHNAYNTWDIPPVAILLMADHSTQINQGIPAETISHPYSGTCITDNQYSDVNGDLLPEMVFGRMAAETEAQMAVLVSKFLEYETQPCMDPYYYQNPITALGWQTERWFQICSEAVGGYWRNQGKTPVRINAIYSGTPGSVWSSNQNTSMVVNYFGPSGTGYIPATPTELGGWSGGTPQQVINAINSGACILQHRDHGFENGWGEPDFQSNHINSLTNVGKMTYVFTINCLTGKFNHSSPCFGEVFHRYTYQGQNAGCVGFLGPTEVSYSFVNDAYAWGMYDLYDPNFLPTYGPQGPHSAAYSGNWMPAFGNVAGKYFLAQSSWPYNTGDKNITYQMFTAHSDVFLRLFTEIPQAPTVTHADVTLAGNATFMISANEGTLIALTATIDGELEILDVATATGAMQAMTIPSTLMPTTEINVVVTGQNFLRYEAIVTVVPASGPYVIPYNYAVVGGGELTYTSVNAEIAVTLKNVGVETSAPATITIVCPDPQITINSSTATCGSIAPDGEEIVNFTVTIANDIPNNKIFLLDVAVVENGKGNVWNNNMSLKAYAPVFSLEKVLVDGVEGGSLNAGTVATLTAVVKNKGGAGAYNVKGDLEIPSPYIDFACGEQAGFGQDLPAGETINIPFTVITDAGMPYGHQANITLSLAAQYGRSHTAPFTVSNTGANNYCTPTYSTGCSSNDKFTQVILYKTSAPSNLLINKLDGACSAGGYENYTNITIPLEPGQQYTIKVKCGFGSQTVKGWFDLNGNNIFDANEQLITLTCSTKDVEYTANFTIPSDFTPGTSRFRLRCVYNNSSFDACNGQTYGQVHDYTITLPELYPRVENVVAVLGEATITVMWDAPAEGTPTGYNVYRDNIKLNTAPLTTTTFTEENIVNGVYVYHVTALYGANESFSEMSNVICNFLPCMTPVDFSVVVEGNTAIITWEDSEGMEGTLMGYNLFRNGTKINSELLTEKIYLDEDLPVGTYNYQTNSVYEHCESDWTEEISITILPCERPLSPEGVAEEDTAIITWNEPENSYEVSLSGYNIYRDGTLLNDTPYTELEYRDEKLENGTYLYHVAAVYEHCEESILTEGVTVEIDFVGINDIQKNVYQIFPNPTHDKLNITGNIVPNSIRIYNITGQLTYETTTCSTHMTISVASMPTGIYFIKIDSDHGSTTQKLIFR